MQRKLIEMLRLAKAARQYAIDRDALLLADAQARHAAAHGVHSEQLAHVAQCESAIRDLTQEQQFCAAQWSMLHAHQLKQRGVENEGRQQLNALTIERDAVADEVNAALSMRDSLDRTREHFRRLQSQAIERASTREQDELWTQRLPYANQGGSQDED